MTGICSKSGKNLEFNSKPGINLKFANSMFQASLLKMSFTKIIPIYFFVISTLSTQTLIRSQIDLGFHCFYLEITWKIHGILWEPWCESTWNMAQKLEKTWNLGPKTWKKTGILYFEKSGKPDNRLRRA